MPAKRLLFLLKALVYPACLSAGIGSYLLLSAHQVPLLAAPYLAVVIAFALIATAERLLPYRHDWQPVGADTLGDLVFMVSVQVLLPLGLGWLSTWALSRLFTAHDLGLNLWPAAWPIAGQVLLKIVIGDFLRYWLHRASHSVPWLWRLHEVHHAPEKLYALNVFRFHPLDKSLQYLCDTLLFLWLGVGPEVLALYFVIYATSGLLQHANIDVRLGPLNYLLSGPEVHRWHHDQREAVARHNFAHTFIVWDLVFGTYYRPRNEQVNGLGLGYAYPHGFLGQMLAPLRRK